MKILDFPNLRQSTIDTCSCVCAQLCLVYYGIDQREDQIRMAMGVEYNPLEVRPEKIVTVLESFGLKALYSKLTLSALKVEIDHGIPVILNLQAWAYEKKADYSKDLNGHYVVAIGYDDKRVIFSDPSSFYNVSLSYRELEKRWHDGTPTDWDYSKMGIVVTGKKPKYSSGKIIRMK